MEELEDWRRLIREEWLVCESFKTGSFNVSISFVLLAPHHLVLLLALPLHLFSTVGTGPPLRVHREEVGVLPLPRDFLHGSHALVLFLGRRLLFCFSSTASRTSVVLRFVGLLLQGLDSLPQLLDL